MNYFFLSNQQTTPITLTTVPFNGIPNYSVIVSAYQPTQNLNLQASVGFDNALYPQSTAATQIPPGVQ